MHVLHRTCHTPVDAGTLYPVASIDPKGIAVNGAPPAGAGPAAEAAAQLATTGGPAGGGGDETAALVAG